MYEVLPGFWSVDGDPQGWLTNQPSVNGLPGYAYGRVQEAVAACEGRRAVALDGGAHVGSWSVHILHHFETLIAFEPMPQNMECLVRNLSRFQASRVMLYECALSDHHGTRIMVPIGRKSYTWRVNDVTDNEYAQIVSCTTIDRLQLPVLDFIKLDLEGHEYQALMGAKETLLRCKPVVVIEEKLDPEYRATQLLTELGMRFATAHKHDRLFTWR